MRFEICLERLKVSAIIGILPNERTKAQDLEVDLVLKYEVDLCEFTHPLRHPSAREGECLENLSARDGGIVDYATLREIILTTFKNNQFLYLENALVAIQSAILAQFSQIIALDLAIKKLHIFSDCAPKVCLKWAKVDCHDFALQNLAMTNQRILRHCVGKLQIRTKQSKVGKK